MSEQKIERFWRDATADDVAEIVKTGKAKEARFRDELKDHWISGSNSFLAGGIVSHRDVIIWISKTTIRWIFCQVYDPPEWFLNKPDPGEGYRLLEKFPDEDKLGTDEAWDVEIREWRVTSIDDGIQCEEVWYRRRIANSPKIPDSCKICAYEATDGELIQLPNGQTIRVTAKGFEVL